MSQINDAPFMARYTYTRKYTAGDFVYRDTVELPDTLFLYSRIRQCVGAVRLVLMTDNEGFSAVRPSRG